MEVDEGNAVQVAGPDAEPGKEEGGREEGACSNAQLGQDRRHQVRLQELRQDGGKAVSAAKEPTVRGRDAEAIDAASVGGKRPQAEVQEVGRIDLNFLHAVRRANKQEDTPKR